MKPPRSYFILLKATLAQYFVAGDSTLGHIKAWLRPLFFVFAASFALMQSAQAAAPTPTVLSINCNAPCTSSAASVSWTVTFGKNVSGVTASNFTLVNTGLGGVPAITAVTGKNFTWTVTASTGTGSGTLRLDMTNSTGVSVALTNLPFAGQVHTIDRTPPTVSSITLVDPTPTALANVSWTVTFSEAVTGVDITDFALAPTGVTGAALTAVTPVSTSVYLVSASTGAGNGVLGLNLVDDDTILDAMGFMLGGTGIGNGNFTGATYDVVRLSLLDHVSITAPATAMTNSATPVTLSAHMADHSALSGYTINLSTSTGLGDWSIGTGAGILTPGPANSGQATYTFGLLESTATLYFTYQTTGTVSINVSDTGGANLLLATPVTELFNTITYSQSGYVFTDSACVNGIAFGAPGQTCAVFNWLPQLAGIDVANVYITTLDAAGVPTRLHPSQLRTVNMEFGLSCHDPVAHAGIQANFSGTVAGVPTTVTLPLCEANGATPTLWSAILSVEFPGGSPSAGPYSFNYADVGKVELWMRNNATIAQSGSSGQFVVAPHHFGISAVTAGPIQAGIDFSATVTAYNGLATPTATLNFGNEITPESVAITFSKCQPVYSGPLPDNSNGTFTSGTIPAFVSGATTAATLNWSEVGNGDLTATLSSGSYLGSGLTATANTGTGGIVCTGAGNVGTFVPHHFNTYVTAPLSTCPTGLTCPVAGAGYSGQPFSVNVVAANASDATTVNYDGTANTAPNFAQAVTLTAWDAAGSTTTQDPPAATPGALSNGNVAASVFSQGSTILTPATPAYTFATSPTAPTDIFLRAADIDATSLRGVPSTSIEGGLKIVSGRFKINNAYGSELLPLTMTATVQFYNGTSWLTSTTDGTTSFNSALSTAGGNVVVSNIVGLGGVVSINSPSVGAVTAGVRAFKVNAPGLPGTADFSLNAPSYLLTGSNGAAVNPSLSGRGTFGIYRKHDAIIYQREAY